MIHFSPIIYKWTEQGLTAPLTAKLEWLVQILNVLAGRITKWLHRNDKKYLGCKRWTPVFFSLDIFYYQVKLL